MKFVNNAVTLLLAASPVWAVAAMPQYTMKHLIDWPYIVDDYNNNGVALMHGEGNGQAYLLQGGTVVHLGTLGGSSAWGRELNDAGAVVGYSRIAAGDTTSHAFVYANGSMRDIGTLGGRNSEAVGINNAGTVIGTSDTAGGDSRAFIYTSAGGMHDIGTLGGAQSRAFDINDAGAVLGTAQTASGDWHNFLYSDGIMTDLTAQYGHTSFFGLGPAGELYGTLYGEDHHGDPVPRAVLERASWYPEGGLVGIHDMTTGHILGSTDRWGLYPTLATPEGTWTLDELFDYKWSFHNAAALNDAGQIVAYGCAWEAGVGCAWVLLSPVPEPATYGMLGLGFGVVALARRRKAAVAIRSA
jgi:probable HAF family extracellular repeat protein